MDQIRMLPVKTGLVALIPSSTIVKGDCFVRKARVERLFAKALTGEDAQGQNYKQIIYREYETIGNSQSSNKIKASDQARITASCRDKKGNCSLCLKGKPEQETIHPPCRA
jgi:hypothetical protein